jgi:hypothetical protein
MIGLSPFVGPNKFFLRYTLSPVKKDLGVFCGIVGGILVRFVLFYVNLWYFGVICGILC